MFDWKRVKEVLNYDYRDLQTNTELVSNIRYAIAGPINIMPYQNLSERKAWQGITGGAWGSKKNMSFS